MTKKALDTALSLIPTSNSAKKVKKLDKIDININTKKFQRLQISFK